MSKVNDMGKARNNGLLMALRIAREGSRGSRRESSGYKLNYCPECGARMEVKHEA